MMKPTYTIAIAAIFMVAAFAGIAIVGDEADAEGVTSYQFADESGNVRIVEAVDGTLTIPSPEALGFNVPNFDHWEVTYDTDKTVIFMSGQSISTATLEAYVTSNVVKFVATPAEITTVNFIVDGKTFAIDPATIEGAIPKTVTDAITAKVNDGFEFLGWTEAAGGETPIEPGEDFGYTNLDGQLTAGKVYTAQFKEIFSVSWVVDETTYVGNVNAPGQPTDPVKENYTFLGWADESGAIVIDPKEAFANSGYEVTKDVTFTAQFKADTMYVTLMVNGAQSGVPIEISYGNAMYEPALPDGYAYWAVKTKDAVYAEDGVTIVTPAEYAQYDFSKAVISDMTLYAIAAEPEPEPEPEPEVVTVTFKIEGKNPYTYEVSDRLQVPATDREGYTFLGWTIEGTDAAMMTTAKVQEDIRNGVYTEDTTFVAVYEVAEPPAPEEPAFYETSTGQIVIVIVIFAILAFGYGVYSNAFGLKDKLFGYTIQKKEKKE